MYELVKVGENTYYMDCPCRVGFYRTGDNEVILIDSGSDKDAAKKVKRILEDRNWKLTKIFDTHSHADHTGGNQYLQNLSGCKIYANKIERSVAESPMLEPIMLYGGHALPELHNKFMLAKESVVDQLTEDVLPEGLTMFELPGHSYDMVGFRTADNVVFLADGLLSAETLDRHKICYTYDIKSYLETLEYIKTLEADCFVPAHAEHTDNIVPLAQKNIDITYEVIDTIKNILETPKTFENLLADVFSTFGIPMNIQQRMLIGCTVKSYLTYLKGEGYIDYTFENNLMVWYKTEQQ